MHRHTLKKKGREKVNDVLNLTSNYSDEGMIDWKTSRKKPPEEVKAPEKKATPRVVK